MRPGLNITLRQTQVLAPQLIQSLKMLQMPLLKLEQTLRHELATNPLLEESEELELESPDAEPEFDLAADKTTPEEADPQLNKIDWDDYVNDSEDFGYKIRDREESREDSFLATTATEKSLYDHLIEQLSMLRLSAEQHQIGEYILGNIDHSGYLVVSPAEMAEELSLSVEKIEEVLDKIRRFDPVGVGSRDLRESLLTQLRERKLEHSLAYRVVEEHLYDLERKSILQIAKLMNVPFEKAQAALDLIKSLSPTPAHGRFESAAAVVIPDMIVERVGEEYVVYHNDRSVPRLRINASYRSLIRRGNVSTEDTKKYISQKLEQARWLINAITQRRNTMIRVMEAIVEEQREFFEKGAEFLKPLIMEDIARKVDMNVATISRVSNGKYVQTPQGVCEIKFFFNTGIARDDGGELSKRNVKSHIEELIKAESPEKPLSDQEIFKQLQTEGVQLARRTVTKYREELGIKPARFRRRSS
jgi:RNA polymerase sigma-54 factor